MRHLTFLIFVALTFCCWGVYGPVLHVGQALMGVEGQLSSLRPFICVGVAYFLIAVLYPMIVLYSGREPGHWSTTGFVWSFLAGAVGAIGALGIILAFKFHGRPVYVMPLVFGCAPVANTLVTMWMARTVRQASLPFYIGIVLVAIGAAGVLMSKPAPAHKPTVTQEAESETGRLSPAEPETSGSVNDLAGEGASESTGDGASDAASDPVQSGTSSESATAAGGNPNRGIDSLIVFLCILITALCWGSYGPVLHKGQARMGGSRLRPFLCVGLAYFAIAVIVPLFLLGRFPEPGGWPAMGVLWSLAAGAAGAIGALGIIYAFNYGGKPIYVMPIVFGFAPVVNTLTETISQQLYGQIPLTFYLSLASVIVGAVTVLVCAPRSRPASPPADVRSGSETAPPDESTEDDST